MRSSAIGASYGHRAITNSSIDPTVSSPIFISAADGGPFGPLCSALVACVASNRRSCPTLPTWALLQVVRYLRRTGCGADAAAGAARGLSARGSDQLFTTIRY